MLGTIDRDGKGTKRSSRAQCCTITLLSWRDGWPFGSFRPVHLVTQLRGWGVWPDFVSFVRELRSTKTSQRLINSEKQAYGQRLDFSGHRRPFRVSQENRHPIVTNGQENFADPLYLCPHLLQLQRSIALQRDRWINVLSPLTQRHWVWATELTLSSLHPGFWRHRPGLGWEKGKAEMRFKLDMRVAWNWRGV